jgi:hypothetical protein
VRVLLLTSLARVREGGEGNGSIDPQAGIAIKCSWQGGLENKEKLNEGCPGTSAVKLTDPG